MEDCCCAAWCLGRWLGSLLWKQQWWSLCGGERSPPGTKLGTELAQAFQLPPHPPHSLASLLSPPTPAFSPACLSLSSPLRLSRFPCPYSRLLFISPPVSPLNFTLSFAPQRQPFTRGTKTKMNKTSSENAKPAEKCLRSQGFCRLSSPELLRGSLFSIAPVWERVRWRSGGQLLASGPLGKSREWRWRAETSLTGHLYWCCEMQR